jgi:prepilin-type N-terminal cleavage/methylation domain-containing protein
MAIIEQRGHTLIELMFAIVIIAISVLALYQMFVTGSGIITEEYHRRVGMEKAQAIMARMQYYEITIDSIPRGLSGTYTEVLIPGDEEHGKGIVATYTLKITHSSERDENNIPDQSNVDGDYSWTERSGRKQTIPLHSYF